MTELRNNAAKGRIIAVCSAPKKGMIKHDIGEGTASRATLTRASCTGR